ncbi:hypothetical protein J6590_089787 [Homalodisca vitripennis]|nr:hypothetical protein J6590_089787 [Homalodisca vitripennis]
MEETPAINHDALVNILSSFKAEICSELKEYRKQFDEFKLALEGIPVTTNEDAVSIATDVSAALGVVLRAEDVMAAHRVPTFRPRAAPPLVVQLRDRRMKETIVAAYKKKKELKASEINKVFTNNKVYVNDHLTPETKNLLRLTKEKSRQWKIINSLTGTNNRNNIETLTLDSGRVLNDSQEIADEINKYLVNVHKQLIDNNSPCRSGGGQGSATLPRSRLDNLHLNIPSQQRAELFDKSFHVMACRLCRAFLPQTITPIGSRSRFVPKLKDMYLERLAEAGGIANIPVAVTETTHRPGWIVYSPLLFSGSRCLARTAHKTAKQSL